MGGVILHNSLHRPPNPAVNVELAAHSANSRYSAKMKTARRREVGELSSYYKDRRRQESSQEALKITTSKADVRKKAVQLAY